MVPGGRTHNGANHPIRHWQAMEADRHWLGCRGSGTHVVRMPQIGRMYWCGGKSFRCVYSELAHPSTPKRERLWARSARRMRFLRATARHASTLRRGDQSHEEVARGHPARRAVCRFRVSRPPIGEWRALDSTAHRPDCWSQPRPLSPRRRTRALAETRSPGLERIGGNDSARGRLQAAEETWPREAPAGAAGASPSGEPLRF